MLLIVKNLSNINEKQNQLKNITERAECPSIEESIKTNERNNQGLMQQRKCVWNDEINCNSN